MNTIELTFNLIKCVLYDEKLSDSVKELLSQQRLGALFSLSKKHDISHIVYYALKKFGLDIEGELGEQFAKEQAITILRYERQKYDFASVCLELEKAKIDYMPVKGMVIKNYYPEPYLRTCCDMDVLVKKQDFERASDIVQNKLGFKLVVESTHDISFTSPSGTNLELHYSLIEDGIVGEISKPLQKVWEAATLKEGAKHRYLLSNELMYYYSLAHTAKHFAHGGCGVRPFVDLVILRRNLKLDKDKLQNLIRIGELDKFATQAELLADIWFGDSEHTELTKKMQAYIVNAGVYGSSLNYLIVKQVKSGSKTKYALARIWLSYKQLKKQYPILEKQKWLYPFCQIARWFRLVFGGRFKYSIKELNDNRKIEESQRKAMVNMLNALGLQSVLQK